MDERYSDAQITRIIDQALVYQCACPAQVCTALLGLRDLHEYQQACSDSSVEDRRVHDVIALAASKAHAVLEQCLDDVLALEQWDLKTLTMPEGLRKRPSKAL